MTPQPPRRARSQGARTAASPPAAQPAERAAAPVDVAGARDASAPDAGASDALAPDVVASDAGASDAFAPDVLASDAGASDAFDGRDAAWEIRAADAPLAGPPAGGRPARDALLRRIGERLRQLREAQGLPRRTVAQLSGLSQRFLAQLEGGEGNISIARLADVAAALDVPVWRLLAVPATGAARGGTGSVGGGADGTADAAGADGATLRAEIARLLEGRSAAELTEVHRWLAARFEPRPRPVALLGLRGAGKTSVGTALAARLEVPFVELDREIERAAGMSLAQLFELEGTDTYRRLQREVLAQVLREARPLVLATGGSIVTDSDCFHRLKTQCLTVWLRARPIDHWNRVVQQGDHRPMAANSNAMAELEALYAARQPLYAEADIVVDTSALSLEACVDTLALRLQYGAAEGALG